MEFVWMVNVGHKYTQRTSYMLHKVIQSATREKSLKLNFVRFDMKYRFLNRWHCLHIAHVCICLCKNERTMAKCVNWKIEWIFFSIIFEMLHYLAALWWDARAESWIYWIFKWCLSDGKQYISSFSTLLCSCIWYCFRIEMWMLRVFDGISFPFEIYQKKRKNLFILSCNALSTVPTKTKTFNFMWKKAYFPRFVAQWKLKAAENRLNYLFTCLVNQIKFHVAIQSST